MLPVDVLVLLTFVPAALALNLTPGADMLFCAGQGLRAGWRAGWAASAGVALGGLIQAAVAGMGVGALVAAHPGALLVIRWLGAGYLLWMAVQILRSQGAGQAKPRSARPFRDGLLVNLTNPKVILFTLAFIPQFIDPAAPVLAQFLTFGAVLSLGGLLVNGIAGSLAGSLAGRLARRAADTGSHSRSGPGRCLQWLSAAIFAGLALRLVFMESN